MGLHSIKRALMGLDPRTKVILWIASISVGILLSSVWQLAGYLLLLLIFVALPVGSLRTCVSFAIKIVAPTGAMLLLVYGILIPIGQDSADSLLSMRGLCVGATIAARLLVIGTATIIFIRVTPLVELGNALRAVHCPIVMTAVLVASFNMHILVVRKIHQIADAQRSRGLKPAGIIRGKLRMFLPILRPLFFGLIIGAVERSSLWINRGYLSHDCANKLKLSKTDIVVITTASAIIVFVGSIRWMS
ncbi:MAG: energy-coupling factor transporter transmembrane component T [Promethearchaeota archaeon]